MADTEYRVRLIELANDLARLGLPASLDGMVGHETEFLNRFRAAYRHLKWTVEASHSEVESDDLAALQKARRG